MEKGAGNLTTAKRGLLGIICPCGHMDHDEMRRCLIEDCYCGTHGDCGLCNHRIHYIGECAELSCGCGISDKLFKIKSADQAVREKLGIGSTSNNPTSGYHKAVIAKGVLGEFSKIEEEFAEWKDAIDQSARLMELCEMADLLGAMEYYLEEHFPGMRFSDLQVMSNLTKRAFQNGQRKSN